MSMYVQSKKNKMLRHFVRSTTILTGHYSRGMSRFARPLGVLLGNWPMTSCKFLRCVCVDKLVLLVSELYVE